MTILIIYLATLFLTNLIYFIFRVKKDKTDFPLFFQLTLIPILNQVILLVQLRIMFEEYVLIKFKKDE